MAATDVNVSFNDGDSRVSSATDRSLVTSCVELQTPSSTLSSVNAMPSLLLPVEDNNMLLASEQPSYNAVACPEMVNVNTPSALSGSSPQQHAVSSDVTESLSTEISYSSVRSSLADLKKQRVKERQEQSNRHRGSDASSERPPLVLSNGNVEHSSVKLTSTGAYPVQSCSDWTDDGQGTRRKHSNRYDLVMPEKKNDVCCLMM